MVDLIDPDIADLVRESVSEGDEIEFVTGPEKRLFLFKILEIKPYSFIVTSSHLGGMTTKLELSIAKTVRYIKETEMRMKAPPPVAATPAPAPQPAPAPSWPMQAPVTPPTPAPMPTPPAPPQTATDPDWIEKELNDACTEFAEQIKTIMRGIIAVAQNAVDATEPQPDGPMQPYTCFDCMFCNIEANRCDKYNQTPLMSIMVDPVGNAVWKCPDFYYNAPSGAGISDNEIPF